MAPPLRPPPNHRDRGRTIQCDGLGTPRQMTPLTRRHRGLHSSDTPLGGRHPCRLSVILAGSRGTCHPATRRHVARIAADRGRTGVPIVVSEPERDARRSPCGRRQCDRDPDAGHGRGCCRECPSSRDHIVDQHSTGRNRSDGPKRRSSAMCSGPAGLTGPRQRHCEHLSDRNPRHCGQGFGECQGRIDAVAEPTCDRAGNGNECRAVRRQARGHAFDQRRWDPSHGLILESMDEATDTVIVYERRAHEQRTDRPIGPSAQPRGTCRAHRTTHSDIYVTLATQRA